MFQALCRGDPHAGGLAQPLPAGGGYAGALGRSEVCSSSGPVTGGSSSVIGHRLTMLIVVVSIACNLVSCLRASWGFGTDCSASGRGSVRVERNLACANI